MTAPVAHVRIITRRRDRRIMGRPGESHTLCGAPVTAYDGRPADARRDPSWVTCPTCRAKVGGRS